MKSNIKYICLIVGIIFLGISILTFICNKLNDRVEITEPIVSIEPKTINRNEIPNKINPKLKVENYKKKKDEFLGWEISGEITNTTGKDIEFLDIRIDCFDKESALIEQGYVNVTDFKKGTTWKFKELILEDFEEIKFIIETD